MTELCAEPQIMPPKEFAIYPKKYLDELMEEIEETKAEIASGKRPVFYTLDAMFANLERS